MTESSRHSQNRLLLCCLNSEVLIFRDIPRDSLARDITAVRVISLNGPGLLVGPSYWALFRLWLYFVLFRWSFDNLIILYSY
jgi:hypothetical protein